MLVLRCSWYDVAIVDWSLLARLACDRPCASTCWTWLNYHPFIFLKSARSTEYIITFFSVDRKRGCVSLTFGKSETETGTRCGSTVLAR